jgi:hypothetical protein
MSYRKKGSCGQKPVKQAKGRNNLFNVTALIMSNVPRKATTNPGFAQPPLDISPLVK